MNTVVLFVLLFVFMFMGVPVAVALARETCTVVGSVNEARATESRKRSVVRSLVSPIDCPANDVAPKNAMVRVRSTAEMLTGAASIVPLGIVTV